MDNYSPCKQCDFLQGNQTADIFGEKSTRIARINEQVVQIDHHIHQLFELRSTLLHRSNQLVSPFYVIPPEIISHIFQDVVRVITDPRADQVHPSRYADLQQSVILISVSKGFRQVALSTPQLWNTLEFRLYSAEQIIDKHLPLLQHCVSHIYNLCLSVHLAFQSDSVVREKHVRPMTQALLSPGINNKVKHLVLWKANTWVTTTHFLSFPALDTLALYYCAFVDLKLETPSVSRISINRCRLRSIVIPPSVQVLDLHNIPGDLVISISHQECPNPVKCSARRGCSTTGHPITIPYLKQLTWASGTSLPTIRNLRLPSLEHLEFNSSRITPDVDMTIILLCEQVALTLTSLSLGGYANFGKAGLRKLCSLKFPHLEKLKFHFFLTWMTFEATEALLFQGERENNVPKTEYMPSLRSLSLENVDGISNHPSYFPPSLLDMLKLKRFGEASPFHLELNDTHAIFDSELWPLELREELESIIRDRDLTLTREGRRFEWYPR